MSSWGIITVTQMLYGRHKHNMTCSYRDCGHSFKIGDKVIRQGRGGPNRYFCPECAEKLRI